MGNSAALGFAALDLGGEDIDAIFADRKVNGVLLDRSGTIVFVNSGWKAFAEEAGLSLPDYGVGQNYLRHCAFADPRSARLIEGITLLLSGRLDCLSYIYPCHAPTERRWFLLLGFARVRDALTALLHIDITGMMPRVAGKGDPLIMSENFAAELLSAPRDLALSGMGETARSALTRGRDAVDDAPVPGELLAGASAPMLSKRQQEVLDLMARGMSNLEIARTLDISPNTVKIHVSGVLARLGLPSRAQAIHWTLTRSQANGNRRSGN